MIRFHINNNYEVRACKATLMPCKFKEHFTDEKEAFKEAENLLLKENESLQTISTLNKLTEKIRVKGILNKESFKNLDPITQKTVIAGINRINSSLPKQEQEYWQTIYEQSPAGKLAMKRLQKTNPAEYAKKTKIAETNSFDDAPTDFSNIENTLSNHSQKEMIMISATWMSNMSPEEIDSIYWTTTHGAGILNKHIRGQEHPSAHNYSKAFLDKQVDLFTSAMNKAPTVEKPVTIYRGTRERNLIIDSLNSPASSSTDRNIADKFAEQKTNNIVMEIHTNKVPSAITMSSWGIEEAEVLAPLGTYENIGEITSKRNNRIVQLKFVG